MLVTRVTDQPTRVSARRYFMRGAGYGALSLPSSHSEFAQFALSYSANPTFRCKLLAQ